MGKLTWIRSRLLIGHTDVENVDPSHVDNDPTTSTRMRTRRRHPLVSYAARNSAYIFFACLFVLFMRAGYLAGDNASLSPYLPRSSSSHSHAGWAEGPGAGAGAGIAEHPITKLMDDAEGEYRAKLGSQSRTLKAAVGEYRRRYGRAPPRGFDEWWAFARENGVRFVDEYDGLVGDLAPFWELDGAELRRRVRQVSELPSIDVVRIRDGEASTLRLNAFEDSEVSARANGFRDMISRFAHKLPDMDFSINAKAEGRVLVPWEHRKYPNLTHEDSSIGIEAMLDGPFRPDWGTDGSVWEAWRRTCPPNSPARRLFSSMRNVFTSSHKSYLGASDTNANPDFNFAKTTSARTLDFCASPHAHTTQGHFFSDWRTLPVLYPVFSPARARGFMDIRIPSHYYYGSTDKYTYGWDAVNLELGDVDRMEVPWALKEDKVFWRGATTGGGSHPPGFAPMYQRHRFLRMASDNTSTPRALTFLSPSSSQSQPHYTTLPLPLSSLNSIMDVAFTKSVSADTLSYPGGLSALHAAHRFADAVPLGAHWKYKYLVDMDGMGYSGRFMAFLASDSVPLKATVYDEFFADWIVPWLHFIPLTQAYNEIYNIHAYFSGPPRAALDLLAALSSGSSSPAYPASSSGSPDSSSSSSSSSSNSDSNPNPHPNPHPNPNPNPNPNSHANTNANSDSDSDPAARADGGEGDRRLRRIARAGKEWKRTVGRTVDMEVYVYRLALEWARLWADDRDAMGFEG